MALWNDHSIPNGAVRQVELAKNRVFCADVPLSEKQGLAIGQPFQSFQPSGRLLDDPRLATLSGNDGQTELTLARSKRARIGQLLAIARESWQYFFDAFIVMLDRGALQC